MSLSDVLTGLASGEAYVHELDSPDTNRKRVIIDMPYDTDAVLLDEAVFGVAGNVRTHEHLKERFHVQLRGGVTHHASNAEWQRYDADGSGLSIEPDSLAITTSLIDEAAGVADGNIRSGMIRSKFVGKQGYYEARMKLSEGLALWPAFWMIDHDGGWPPEFGFEQVNNANEGLHKFHPYVKSGKGTENQIVRRTLCDIWGAYRVGATGTTPLADEYHTYGIEWIPSRNTLRHYFDDQPVIERTYRWLHNDGSKADPANYIINLAVGGNWAGSPDETTIGRTMNVKWVRVWNKRPTPARVAVIEGRAH